jgi:hypothetical protein
MKKLIFVSYSLFLVLVFNLNSIDSFSQEIKLSSQERKAIKETQRYVNFQIIDSLVTGQNFVLKAEFLKNRYGDRIIVIPTLNFIRVDSSKVVLQTGAVSGAGYNGVGGVTAEGNVTGWKLVRDTKKLSIFLRFSVITNIGSYDVALTVDSDNNATARISGLTPGTLIYEGHLETIFNAKVFKGENSI